MLAMLTKILETDLLPTAGNYQKPFFKDVCNGMTLDIIVSFKSENFCTEWRRNMKKLIINNAALY